MAAAIEPQYKPYGGIFTTEILIDGLPNKKHKYHAIMKQVINNIFRYKIWVRTTEVKDAIQEAKNVFRNKESDLVVVYDGSTWKDLLGNEIQKDHRLITNYSYYYVVKTKDNTDYLNNQRKTIISCKPETSGTATQKTIGICTTFPRIIIDRRLESEHDSTHLNGIKLDIEYENDVNKADVCSNEN
jgi:hypothetical protein